MKIIIIIKGYNNTDKMGNSKTTKENSSNKREEMKRKHTNNRMQEKPNDFWPKIREPRKHNEKGEWINNITKELVWL